jgi:hypothetical protein
MTEVRPKSEGQIGAPAPVLRPLSTESAAGACGPESRTRRAALSTIIQGGLAAMVATLTRPTPTHAHQDEIHQAITENELARMLRVPLDGEMVTLTDPDSRAAVAEALTLLRRVGELMLTRMPDRDGIARSALADPIEMLSVLSGTGDTSGVDWFDGWPGYARAGRRLR